MRPRAYGLVYLTPAKVILCNCDPLEAFQPQLGAGAPSAIAQQQFHHAHRSSLRKGSLGSHPSARAAAQDKQRKCAHTSDWVIRKFVSKNAQAYA